jgi:large repetitive protein
MNRLLSCSVAVSTISWLFSLVVVLHDCSLASAQTVVINYTDRGWYNETGFHDPINSNYVVGDTRGPDGSGCATCTNDERNFFVFDLAGVTEPIVSAKLALNVPNFGYASPDLSENYELYDVVTPISTLVAGGAGNIATWDDLGSGVIYGSRTMTAADAGTGRIVEIVLNSSVIDAMNSTGGLFAFGGSLTTLDGLANDEFTFGFSGAGRLNVTQLRLTLVPEPSTLLLLGIGAISLLAYRRREVV